MIQEKLTRMKIKFHTYYGGDDAANLARFSHGELDCLIACKRISEGIDIQSINNIVLFSTAKAPIETVQRAGRCLRTDPTNPFKRASIVDFIKVEDNEVLQEAQTDYQRRDWFSKMSSTRKVE